MKYTELSVEERKALPDEYWAMSSKEDAYSKKLRAKKDKPIIQLDFEGVMVSMDFHFRCGLPSCGSGIAAWEIPAILKSKAQKNKRAELFHLFIRECCGSCYTPKEIRDAWAGYTSDQKEKIEFMIDEYLDLCLCEMLEMSVQ